MLEDLRFGILDFYNIDFSSTKEYTLLRESLGEGHDYNTAFTKYQFCFALCISKYPGLKSLLVDSINSGKLNFGMLKSKQVLENMRILDLGCGLKPSFARLSRVLGAEVYTVDNFPADKFVYEGNQVYTAKTLRDLKELEKNKHIYLDLSSQDDLSIIREQISGEFDLVTAVHLETGRNMDVLDRKVQPIDVESIALSLLREKGRMYVIEYSQQYKMKINNMLEIDS